MLSHCQWHWQLFTTLGNVNTSACQTLLYPGWYIQIQFVRFFGIYYQHKSYFGGRRKKRAKLFSPQQPEFWQFFVCQSSKRELLGGDFFNRAWLPWVSTTNRQQWWNRHFIEQLLNLWQNENFLFFGPFLQIIWIHFWQGVIITTLLYHLYTNFSVLPDTVAATFIHYSQVTFTTVQKCNSPWEKRWC